MAKEKFKLSKKHEFVRFFKVELEVVDGAESEAVDFLLKHSCLVKEHWSQFGTICSTIIVVTNDLCRLDALCILFNEKRKLFRPLYIKKYRRILFRKQTYKHFYMAHNEGDECNPSLPTGEELLNSLLLRGEYAGYDTHFSDGEIYIALNKCKHLICPPFTDNDISCADTSPLSARQSFCSEAAIKLIMENKYNHALHEFEDCIDDYGKGRSRYVTKNEMILYNCILTCFIAKLEE